MPDVGLIAYADDELGGILDPAPMLSHAPAATNSQIRSNDLANVEWTPTNMTVGNRDEVGLQAVPNTACTLTAAAANATLIASAITAASAMHASKWYVKRALGTGPIEFTLDGGTSWQDITSLIGSEFGGAEIEGVVTNPQIGIRIVTNGDAVVIGNAECYLNKSITEVRGLSPIITEGVAVSTTSDKYSFDIANHDNNELCLYFELQPSYGSSEVPGNISVVSVSGLASIAYINDAAQPIRTNDGTQVAACPNFTFNENDNIKIGIIASISDNKMQVNVNGSWGVDTNYDGYAITSALTILDTLLFTQRMRDLQRWDIIGNVAQRAKIDQLMAA